MKKLLLSLLFSGFSYCLWSQSLAINTDGSTANTSALLDVKSTSKGMLIPRMSKVQRNAIATPANGLIVYVNAPDTVGLCFYDGFVWKWMEEKGNGWSLTGNAGTNPANNYVGTNDMTDLAFRIGGLSEYMRLTKEAELGISESDPKYALDIRTGWAAINNCLNNGIRVKRNFANNNCETGLLLGYPLAAGQENNALLWNYGNIGAQAKNILFGLGNVEIMRVTDNRELGINEQAPKYNLDVTTGGTGFDPCIRGGLRLNTYSGGNDCNKGLFLGFDTMGVQNKISLWNFTPNANSTNQYIRFGFGPNFSQEPPPTGFGEAMRILPPGQGVGIGVTQPLAMLHIMKSTGPVGPPSGVMVTRFGLPGPEFRGFYTGLSLVNNPSGNDAAMWNYQNASINFGTNNTDRMRITDNGYIGINTINPYAGLHVDGHNVFFTNAGDIPVSPPVLDVNGAGRRLLWYADQAAFRAGYVSGSQWDFGQIGNYSFAAGNSTKASGSSASAFGANTTASGNQSVAMGSQTSATGSHSFASGLQTTASGISSVALGENTIASALASVALGYHTNATGMASVAMGYQSNSSNDYAIAFGKQTNALADFAFSAGEITNATGIASFAVGSQTNASGNYSVTAGNTCIASGISSFAAGDNARAFGDYSTTIGNNIFAHAYSSFTAGSFNENSDSPNGSVPAPADRIFQIGNGSASLRSNALTVLRNGNVGISNTDPAYPMDVYGQIRLRHNSGNNAGVWLNKSDNTTKTYVGLHSDDYLGLWSNSNPNNGGWGLLMNTNNGMIGIGTATPGFPLNFPNTVGDKISLWGNSGAHYGFGIQGFLLQIHSAGSSDDIAFGYGSSASFTENMRIKGTGNVGIGTNAPSEKLHVIGNILATGTITPSDARYKKGIKPITNSLEKLQQLNGVTYRFNQTAFPEWQFDDKMQYGLIAQEVEKVFPEMVKTIDEKGYKGIDYVKLIPVLLEAIKELKNEIDLLKNK